MRSTDRALTLATLVRIMGDGKLWSMTALVNRTGRTRPQIHAALELDGGQSIKRLELAEPITKGGRRGQAPTYFLKLRGT